MLPDVSNHVVPTDTIGPASYEYRPIVQEFHHWVETNKIKGIQGDVETSRCFFLPNSALKARFTTGHVRQLNEAVLGTTRLPFNVKDILDDYCKVFCILLEIGKGEYLEHFSRDSSLCDQRLPFEPESRPQSFPNVPNDPEFFTKFCEKQWLVCPPEFRKKSDSKYRKEVILPIIESTYKEQGGSARIYQIKLHQCYDKLDEPKNPEAQPKQAQPKQAQPKQTQPKQTQPKQTQPKPTQPSQNPKTYILKQYHTETAERDYKAEVEAYRLLGDVPNLIKFYMGYKQGNTYNVILEHADVGTLEDFWNNISPPSTGIDIYHFFTGLLNLAGAVKAIHQVYDGKERLQGNGTDSRESPFEYQFKLADFGISHFKSSGALRRQATDVDTSGTLTYGAPETYRSSSAFDTTLLHVSPAVDIWSLSAVLSEACIWVAYGMCGLGYYRRIRGDATMNISNFRAGNCFHDGRNVLNIVEKMHNGAQLDLLRSDILTHEIWLHLVKPNLTSRPDARSDATDLWRLSVEILGKAESMLHCSTFSRKEFLQPLNNGVGTLTKKRAKSFGKTNDGRNNDPSSRTSRSLFDPVVQLDDGPETDFLAICSSTGCQTVNEDTIEQGISQEPLNMQPSGHVDSLRCSEDEPRYGSVSKQAQQTNGYMGNGIIRSWNSKGRTTSADASQSHHPSTPHDGTLTSRELVWLAKEAIRCVKSRPDHKSEFSQRGRELETFYDLKGRDHVFLLDDSSSMLQHWGEVHNVLEVLSRLVKKHNPKGTKVHFTTTDGPPPYKKTTLLVNAVWLNQPQGYSDMKGPLSQILDEYRTRDVCGRKSFWSPKATRPLTLYIFTNGLWQDNVDVHKPIEHIVKYLEEERKSLRTVGIQFIRFGDDLEGGKRLDYLSKRLNLSMDIVDTELSTGNVYKMLLGSIYKIFDNGQIHSIGRSTAFHPTITKNDK